VDVHVRSKWLGKRHFQADGPTGNTVYMDARPDDGGTGQGNSPMELVLMGLVGCTGIDITMILERMRQPLLNLDIDAVGKRKEDYPKAYTEIHVTYKMVGDIASDKAWRAIHLSEEKYCSATASLSATIVPHLILNGTEVPSTAPDGLPD